MAKKIKLGARVVYRDSQGFPKLGLVTGTSSTVKKGQGIPTVGENEAHVLVFSPSGSSYHRHNIAQGDGPRTFSLL